MYQSTLFNNQSNTEIFKKAIENIDFLGATVRKDKDEKIFNRIITFQGRVRYLNGGRIGEVLVEQFVGKKQTKVNYQIENFTLNLACRMMKDGTCTIPCYVEEEDCNLTVVKVFLAEHFESKEEPPILYKLNRIMWHGELKYLM